MSDTIKSREIMNRFLNSLDEDMEEIWEMFNWNDEKNDGSKMPFDNQTRNLIIDSISSRVEETLNLRQATIKYEETVSREHTLEELQIILQNVFDCILKRMSSTTNLHPRLTERRSKNYGQHIAKAPKQNLRISTRAYHN